MSKTFPVPQGFETDPRPAITLNAVDSNRIAAIGHDPATNTLAVQFKRSTAGEMPIYHYPDVTAEQHAAFVGAESIGKHFGAHISALPFKKYRADPETAAA